MASDYINIVDEKTLQQKVYNKILEDSEISESSSIKKMPKNSSFSKKSKIKKSVSFQDTPGTSKLMSSLTKKNSKSRSSRSRKLRKNPKTSNFDLKEKSKNSSPCKSEAAEGKNKQTAAFNSPQNDLQGQGVNIYDKSKSTYLYNSKPLVDYDSFRSLSITNNLDNLQSEEHRFTEQKKNRKKQK